MDIKQINLLKRNKYLIVKLSDFSDENEFLDDVGTFLKTGIDILEISGENCSDKKIFLFGKKIRELSAIYNCLLIVRSRFDIAKILCADGIFLDDSSLPVSEIKKISEDLIIGTNSNNIEFVDYIISMENQILNSDIPEFILKNNLNPNNINKEAIFFTKNKKSP